MAKRTALMLIDVGDTLFRVLQSFLFRDDKDLGAEMTITSNNLQESVFLMLADTTSMLIKSFPHKNYMQKDVFRVEVFRTRPGDMRGNKVAFFEISCEDGNLLEIKTFLESVMKQCGL